jgi:hypothetical protein
LSTGDIFTALGVVVAGLAALLAGYYSKKTLQYSQCAERSAQEANDHSVHANVLSANTWLDQYMTNVRLWADEGCECISVAIHAVHGDDSRRDELLLTSIQKLSSLVDRGRWFFPNLWADEYGQNKEPAFRGLRQPILDCLMDAHYAVKRLYELKQNDDIEQENDAVHELVHCQRIFVSEVQQVLNPRRREREIERITEQFAISEKLRGNNGSSKGNTGSKETQGQASKMESKKKGQ